VTSRSCSICAHRQRKAIDKALIAGESIRTVAGRYGVPKSTLADHKAHLDTVAGPVVAEVAAARAVAVRVAEAEVREALVDTTRTTLQRVQDLGGTALKCLARVTGKLDGPDPDVPDALFDARGAAALMGQSLKALELQAKLLGELQSGTQVNVLVQAERTEFVRVVLGALADEPAALAKVAAAVERAAAEGGGR